MDCIILDIDGTLWDTTPIVAEAWNVVLNKRTDVAWRATADNLKALFGRPLPVIASMIFPELSDEEQLVLIDECCEEEHRTLEQTPGGSEGSSNRDIPRRRFRADEIADTKALQSVHA